MDDARHSSVDHLGEAWAQELPPVETEGYVIAGRMEEQDGRFNINNLVLNGQVVERQLEVFRRLLALLRLPGDLAWNVADWIDSDQEPLRAGSAESAYYLGLAQPYEAADRPLVSLDELVQVKDMNKDILEQLRPYVTVLPSGTKVNVNTASAEVLAALSENMTLEEAHAVVARRERAWFRDTADFERAYPPGLAAPTALAALSSEYFIVRARANHGRVAIGNLALLRRNGSQPPTIVWRKSL
jgi:general secretion pathway protein K